MISIALALALPAATANALTVENVSVSETGGITVSGEATASGSSDASAEVRSVIQGTGADTRVRVDIRTSAGGEEHATSVMRVIPRADKVEMRIATSSEGAGFSVVEYDDENDDIEAATTSPASIFESILESLTRILERLFFFW